MLAVLIRAANWTVCWDLRARSDMGMANCGLSRRNGSRRLWGGMQVEGFLMDGGWNGRG